MTQSYHNNLKKELFNVFWNAKDKKKEFVFRFWLRQIIILSQIFFLIFYILDLDVLWNGQSFRIPYLFVKY